MTPKRSTLKLDLAWVLSLVVVAAASRLMLAQTTGDKRIVTGSDLGFRIDSDRGGVPTGRFVVRVNGTWVEVKETVGAARLTQ
jgi:hypothetical protein